MQFDWTLALVSWPELLRGWLTTLALIPLCAVLGFFVAVPIAIAKDHPATIIRWPALSFSVFFRGAPALIVLYLIYNGFPQFKFVRNSILWTFFSDPVNCAILALSLNHAAFLSEIFRGGLAAVPKGIVEAAKALSLPSHILYRKVLFPLAFRYAFSSYRNELVFMIKATSIVGSITVFDLLAAANEAVERTYDPTTPLVMAGVLYWFTVNATQIILTRVEGHLRRYDRV